MATAASPAVAIAEKPFDSGGFAQDDKRRA